MAYSNLNIEQNNKIIATIDSQSNLTCFKWPPKGEQNHGHIKQMVSTG